MNNFSNIDLVTSVDLSNAGTDEKPVYHFVYGSQLYGTMFGVFARFKIEATHDGTIYNVSKMHLKLLNYQGIINLGFKGSVTYSVLEQENGDLDHAINFSVQGTSTQMENELRFADPLTIKKGQRLRIIFKRTLYPLPGFEFDSIERTTRNPADRLESEVPAFTLFDTEFQYRSGTDYFDQALRPGMTGATDATLALNYRWVSIRCIEGIVNLYF